MKLLATVRFDAVELAARKIPLLPHPLVLFCRMSLILLPEIVPVLIAKATRIPLMVELVPVDELMPAMVLLVMVKFCALPSRMPRKLSLSATTDEPIELPVMTQL